MIGEDLTKERLLISNFAYVFHPVLLLINSGEPFTVVGCLDVTRDLIVTVTILLNKNLNSKCSISHKEFED